MPQLSRPAEEQDVAVGVLDLEAALAVVRILQRYAEGCASRGELGRQRVGVRRMDVGVPSCPAVALRIGERLAAPLEEDLRRVATDDGKERMMAKNGSDSGSWYVTSNPR